MSYFLVGPEKRSLFGGKKKWNFNEAVAAAVDGDVIEIEQGFCPINEQNNESVEVNKSITIQGGTLALTKMAVSFLPTSSMQFLSPVGPK